LRTKFARPDRRPSLQEWLQNALWRLPDAEHDVLRALHAFDTYLITLNYDELIEHSAHKQLEQILSRDKFYHLDFLRGNDQGKVLHQHGYCDRAATMILDASSHANLLRGVEKLFAKVLGALLWTVGSPEIVHAFKERTRFFDRTGRRDASSLTPHY
jgi:hypothetical protein